MHPAALATATAIPAPVREVEPRVILSLEQRANARKLLAAPSAALLLARIDAHLGRLCYSLARAQRGQLAHTQHAPQALTCHSE